MKERKICVVCQGEIIGGEPAHAVERSIDSKYSVDYYCREHIEELSEASWPDDKWGPYPYVQHHKAGHA